MGAWPHNAVVELHPCRYDGILAHHAVFAYIRCRGDGSLRMDALGRRQLQQGIEIGGGCTQLVPVPPIGHQTAHASATNDLQPCGDDGKGFVRRNIREKFDEFRLHDVDAGKLVGTRVDAESVAHVSDATCGGIKAHVFLAIYTAQGKGHQVAGSAVFRQELRHRKIAEDVAVLDDQRLIRVNKRHDVAYAAAGVQRVLLMAQQHGTTAVLRVRKGESALPHDLQLAGIYEELGDTAAHQMIHGVVDERLLEDGQQRFGHDVREGSQASAKACSQDKGLHRL